MPAGDKIVNTRVRGESNERLDLQDFERLSSTSQVAGEAMTRSLITSPKATPGAPTGERWQGSITANPTGASDGLFRVDSPAFVGVDADGGLVLKAAGVTLSTSVPSGGSNQQIYLYMADAPEDMQVRRKLPATGPFIEFPQAMNVAWRKTANLYVRAGNAATVVAEDAVAGATRALLFLGVATNTGGVVTFTPAANTLETVTPPTSVPTTDTGTTAGKTTTTGSSSSLRDLINAALYVIGNAVWKGSDTAPTASNNYLAYKIPSGGVDKAFKQALGFVTIGNGNTVFGDYNTNAYGSAKLLLDAAIAALPTAGGTILIKRGVQLSGFASSGVSMPAGKTVEIVGEHADVPNSLPAITFAAGESLVCSATGKLVLRNLHFRWVQNAVTLTTAPCVVRDCFFDKAASVDSGAALQGTTVSDLDVDGASFSINLTTSTTNGLGIRCTGQTRRIRIRKTRFLFTNLDSGGIQIDDVREDVLIDDTTATVTGSFALPVFPAIIRLNTLDNATNTQGRYVRNVFTTSTTLMGVWIGNLGFVTITNVDVVRLCVASTGYLGAGPIIIERCRGSSIQIAGEPTDLQVNDCRFTGYLTTSTTFIGSSDPATLSVGSVVFNRCKWEYTAGAIGTAVLITAAIIRAARFIDCEFFGVNDPTTPAVHCVQLRSGIEVIEIKLLGCTIRNFQNIAYASADATTPHKLVTISAKRLQGLQIANNACLSVMSAASGNARIAPYFVNIESLDGLGISTGTLMVQSNRLGLNDVGVSGEQDFIHLFRASKIYPNQLIISDNICRTGYSNGVAGATTLSNLVSIDPGLGNDGSIKIANNMFSINTAAAPPISMPINFIYAPALGSYYFAIEGNDFFVSTSAAGIFDNGAGGYGINLTSSGFACFVFTKNAASSFAAGGPLANFKMRLVNAPANMLPALPANGVAFAENLNIVRST